MRARPYPNQAAKPMCLPRPGTHATARVLEGVALVGCAFMGASPDAADDRWLREACDGRVSPACFAALKAQRMARPSR